jgi:hypothetical protein
LLQRDAVPAVLVQRLSGALLRLRVLCVVGVALRDGKVDIMDTFIKHTIVVVAGLLMFYN